MDILIIDDAALLRERLKAELEHVPGVRIAGECSSLTQARKLAPACDPDVVFLDIRLKDGVSIGFIETLKKLRSNPKVIVLTNYPYPQYRSRCMEAGADFFLEKKKEFSKITGILSEIHPDGGK